jgi:hypothetical protein
MSVTAQLAHEESACNQLRSEEIKGEATEKGRESFLESIFRGGWRTGSFVIREAPLAAYPDHSTLIIEQ